MAKVAHEDPQVQRKAPQHSQPELAAHEKKLLHTSPAHSSTAHTQEATEKRNATHASDHSKLKIELYYESRCPDCVLFINNTLGPLWRNEELNAHIDLVMNPYGNAMTVPMSQISEGYKYWHPERAHGWDYVHICQHGGEECFGNTIQACAISKLPQEKHMELILCMESLPDWGLEKSSYECMEKFSIDKDKIKECAKGAEGNKLLGEFGHKTNQVPDRGGTPWLMINNVHLENPSNLLKAVCAHVGPGPESCKPFEHEHGHAHHEDSGSDEGDEFQVFGKMNNVDKSLVILPPPKKV
jgi:interferon gamma-inducible protein 30